MNKLKSIKKSRNVIKLDENINSIGNAFINQKNLFEILPKFWIGHK